MRESNYRPLKPREKQIEEWRLRHGLTAVTPQGEVVQPMAEERGPLDLPRLLAPYQTARTA